MTLRQVGMAWGRGSVLVLDSGGLRLRKNRSYPRTKYVDPPADVAAAADVAIGAGLGEQAELHLHGK